MNEELQSTNEELQAMNDDMRQRGDELNQVNSFLECILTSLRGGVVVPDTDPQDPHLESRSGRVVGVREQEGAKTLLGLDIDWRLSGSNSRSDRV